ncbi:MAG: Rrf2 family transcriptional regulator [Eggerthellales bacterium]|nr:Rrf2 family transcriptional regulator [Eggerthellales bacterium]
MELTRKSDYALRIIRAAYENAGEYISVSEVSERENIPYAFARSIQHDLVHAGILKTVRGAKGGLMLDCCPDTTTLLEVLTALQGSVSVSPCSQDYSYCDRCGACEFHQVWQRVDSVIENLFNSITLTSLFEGRALANVNVVHDWSEKPSVRPQVDECLGDDDL